MKPKSISTVRASGPPELRDVQRWMASQILATARPPGDFPLDLPLRLPGGVDTHERLAVYAGGYPARLQDALRENFPALFHVLGVTAFRTLVTRYVRAHPPCSYNLNDAGSDLPRFLHDRGDPTSVDLPFLADLAELEWRIVQAFHARLGPGFDPASLSRLTPERWADVVLHGQAGVAVVRSPWPIRELWAARETPIEDIDIDLRNRPDRVLVHRAGSEVRVESLTDEEASVLVSALAGRSLGEIAEELLDAGGDPAEVGRWIGGWVGRGLVGGIGVSTRRAPDRRVGL